MNTRPPYVPVAYAAMGLICWGSGLWLMPYSLGQVWSWVGIAAVAGTWAIGAGRRNAGVLVTAGGLMLGFGAFDAVMPWLSLIHRPEVFRGLLIGQVTAVVVCGGVGFRSQALGP